MASGVRLFVWCCVVLFVVLRVISAETLPSHKGGWAPAPEFARHTLVKPKIYHGREKREIASTRQESGGHVHDLIIGYNANGQDYVLDLQLNRDLIPKLYFEKYQHDGVHVVNKPKGKDVELCYYRGQLRGVPNSWAAISTCYGISGVIFDGKELHYLERNSSDEDSNIVLEASDSSIHILYSHSDLIANKTCGYSGTSHQIENKEFHRILRYKRDTEEVIHGPYNANKQSRYVELVLVVDNKGYKERGENLQKVYHHCKEIANIVNSLYVPLNIFVALVGVMVWTEFDEISIVASGDTTLTNFLHYRRERLVKDHPNDNAQLLTRVVFDGGVVGKALKGPICTYEFSGGVSMDHSSVVGLVATTVAHEMGHNFGMEHDTNECSCPSERCIMAPSSSSVTPTQWSSCSLEYLALAFEHGMDYCLRNKPTRLFDSPVCGNGFVEAGEQCDCGLKDLCDNSCCNATSCMLYSNASCATGECCDLKTCHPKVAGSMCRSADHECDLPEYCTGQSEYCPDDVFKMDGETCHRGMAFCYQGSCRTHSDQCQLLWGPSGKSSDKQCYEMNTKGSRNGNCGYNRVNQSYIKCSNTDIECGMLHCMHLNERLEFGMESVAILSHSFINAGGRVIPCRTAIVDLGLNQVDPGLSPDGSKCGDGKMCVNQKCMAVGDLRKAGVCPNNCAGNGVCNSLGHCHCNTGFAPPLCDYPGAGGSEDSGPASDPEGRRVVITALYAIFLGIVPFLALIAMMILYMRRNVMQCWKKGSRPSKSGAAVTDSSRSPPSKQGDKKFVQHRNSRSGSMAVCNGTSGSRKMEISGPLPSYAPAGSDNALTSLLPKQDGKIGITPAATPLDNSSGSGKSSNFQNNLLSHFKGFSIISLASSCPSTTTNNILSPPSKMANAVSPPTVPPGTVKPPRPPSILAKAHNTSISRNASMVGCIVSTASSSVTVDPPTVTFAPLPRPVISSPILDTTTCTAKELTSSVRPVPSRPAPQIPTSTAATTAQKPVRPLSSPNTLSVNPVVDEKKGKDGGGQTYPTLTRLASFMLRHNSDGDKHKDKMKSKMGDGTNSLPRKASKLQIDREALRNLKISNPIPQQEIGVPENAVPVMTEVENKQVVMRAQSLRDTGHTGQRPAIPTFGSMRHPSGTKRPTSIPSGMRPSSPPPPRPPLQSGSVDTGIIGLPGYQNPPIVSSPTDYGYDDCFNLLAGGSAPLANIDEESSPTNGGGNIYAVIEESPPECGRKNVLRDEVHSRGSPSVPSKTSHYASPMLGDYKSPKPLDNSTSAGSIESVGLLSEIVNEIQARNLESIYSSSNDKKMKSDDDDGNSSITTTDHSVAGSSSPPLYGYKSGNDACSISSQGTYINAPYSSSNIYGGGSSVYSNISMQNNPANSPSPNVKSSLSSSSSSSGYLSPTPPLSSAPSIVQSMQPNNAAITNLPGTFKNSKPTTPSFTNSSASAKEDKSLAPANLLQNLSSYKPYSSSFHRPLGPLAAASFKSSASSAPSDDASSPSQVPTRSKVTPGSTSQSNSPLVNAEERKPPSLSPPASSKPGVPPPNKSSLHQSALAATTLSGPSKLAGAVMKAAPSVPGGGSKLNRTESKPSNSPDVVSSCSTGTSGDASRSPDIIGGKAGLKPTPKSPDVASKQQIIAPAVGVGRSASSVAAAGSKFGASSVANKPAAMHSSFRSKQPQTAPKPNILKPSAVGDKTRAPTGAGKSKPVPGVSKSVSDVGANRTMPTGARAAASKLSHVASLQQKFETAGSGNDKTGSNVNRTVSGVGSKTKVPSSAGKTGAAKK